MTQKKERIHKFKELKGLETVPFQLKKYWKNLHLQKEYYLHYFPGIVILIEVILQEKEAFGQCPDVSDDRFAENGRGLWKK